MRYSRKEYIDVDYVEDIEPVIHDGRLWFVVQDNNPDPPLLQEFDAYRPSDLFLYAPLQRYGDFSDCDADLRSILAALDDIDSSILDELSYDDLASPSTHQKLMDFAEQHGFYISPVYAYIHGLIRFSLSPFGDSWDSGHCGWIWAFPDYVREAEGWGHVHAAAQERIDDLNMYVSGDVYCICSAEIEHADADNVCIHHIYDYEASSLYGLDVARETLKELTREP